MILRYWGERGLDAESFAHLVDRSAGGIRTDRLVGDLRARGWSAAGLDGTGERMSAELDRGRPVLALIEDRPRTFHYVVVVAATPRAVVFHDPARAPFRVMAIDAFARRWEAADRWMAIVVPRKAVVETRPRSVAERASGNSSCTALIEDGIRLARSNDLDAAERSLTAALSCGGSAPLREMAGLRLLQRRWSDVGETAAAALAIDPGDEHAWDLLATSRFVQDDPVGALDAWNRIDRPQVDLVSVDGLEHTGQRAVERLMGVPGEALLTSRLFTVTKRRLQELPSAVGTRLEYRPAASGLAEVRAHVVERPLLPFSKSNYLAMGLLAVARSEISASTGSIMGGGERSSGSWRFWPDRPRVDAEIVAPAPWGGLWGVEGFGERQPFTDAGIPTARRAGAIVTVSNWINPWMRLWARGGVDAWEEHGSFGLVSGGLRAASPRERIVIDVEGSGWSGGDAFASLMTAATLRSSGEHRGRVYIARAGASAATASTPPDIWFGGDTGRARPTLLRAHPIIDDGALRVEQIGRRIVHVSVEARQWWTTPWPIRVGAALFVDSGHVNNRSEAGARGDVDTGLGARLAVPGLDGVFRLDLAKGLRDGATAFSFVYETSR
jgi:hypothetical protein